MWQYISNQLFTIWPCLFVFSVGAKKIGSYVNMSVCCYTDTVSNAQRASRSLNYRYLFYLIYLNFLEEIQKRK